MDQSRLLIPRTRIHTPIVMSTALFSLAYWGV
jgi:hypothetical protein